MNGIDPGDMTHLEFQAWQANGGAAAAVLPVAVRRKHEWDPSRVGHGEFQCAHCFCTNREAWVLGEFCING